MLQKIICALMATLPTCSPSFARASYHTGDCYNPQHIDRLPAHVRGAIYRKCSDPKARYTARASIAFDEVAITHPIGAE
jgi:hypothetical protein